MSKSRDILLIDGLSTPTRPGAGRFSLLYIVLVTVVLIFISRSYYLQVVEGSSFRYTAEGNRVETVPVTAPRGIIYDWQGNQLVENVASTDVVLDPIHLPTVENEAILIEQLPPLLDLSVEEVQQAIAMTRQNRRITPLKVALDHDTVLELERRRADLPGVQLLSSLVRRYPFGTSLAPVLGYTAPVSADELSQASYLSYTDITGKIGIEKHYDEVLHGEHGISYVEVAADGVARKQVEEKAPVPGAGLYLTLDSALQEYIYSVLEEVDAAHQEDRQTSVKAAVVAMDPRSGALRALVSYPAYDANVFSQPRLRDQTANVVQDERQLLFNRPVLGTYPPGSTIKPFIAAGALQEGVITSDTTFLSTGGLSIGPWSFPDWKAGGHGTTDVVKAIAESVNTFFYIIAGGYEQTSGLGPEKVVDYLSRFGWGRPTGIDLSGEASGFLPSRKWKQEVKGEPWYIGDTYHLAIGQGDVLATPLQVALATAAIANDGSYFSPFLVRAREPVGGELHEQVTERHTVGIDASHIAIIQQAMRATVTQGSAQSLADMTVAIAGKTGTAQIGGTEDTHAWFTSFGPYENPALVLTILIERGGGGDVVAVPVARKIWEYWAEQQASERP